MSIETTGCTILTSMYGNGWCVAVLMRDDPRAEAPYVVAWDVPGPVVDDKPTRARGRASYELKVEAMERANKMVDEQVERVMRAMNGHAASHLISTER